MRYCLLLSVLVLTHTTGLAQPKPTKEETVKWLQKNVVANYALAKQKSTKQYATKMCVNLNLLPDDASVNDSAIATNFKDKIVSHIRWKQNQLDLQNDIFLKGKLSETYTYQIPVSAISWAHITNCQRNESENVNGYMHRPIFVTVKKNTVHIIHRHFYYNGRHEATQTTQYYMNTKEADWNSVIPIAGNWDSHPDLQQQIIAAFIRLAEYDQNEYSAR